MSMACTLTFTHLLSWNIRWLWHVAWDVVMCIIHIYIYIHMCVCVRVCVCVRHTFCHLRWQISCDTNFNICPGKYEGPFFILFLTCILTIFVFAPAHLIWHQMTCNEVCTQSPGTWYRVEVEVSSSTESYRIQRVRKLCVECRYVAKSAPPCCHEGICCWERSYHKGLRKIHPVQQCIKDNNVFRKEWATISHNAICSDI